MDGYLLRVSYSLGGNSTLKLMAMCSVLVKFRFKCFLSSMRKLESLIAGDSRSEKTIWKQM